METKTVTKVTGNSLPVVEGIQVTIVRAATAAPQTPKRVRKVLGVSIPDGLMNLFGGKS